MCRTGSLTHASAKPCQTAIWMRRSKPKLPLCSKRITTPLPKQAGCASCDASMLTGNIGPSSSSGSPTGQASRWLPSVLWAQTLHIGQELTASLSTACQDGQDVLQGIGCWPFWTLAATCSRALVHTMTSRLSHTASTLPLSRSAQTCGPGCCSACTSCLGWRRLERHTTWRRSSTLC